MNASTSPCFSLFFAHSTRQDNRFFRPKQVNFCLQQHAADFNQFRKLFQIRLFNTFSRAQVSILMSKPRKTWGETRGKLGSLPLPGKSGMKGARPSFRHPYGFTRYARAKEETLFIIRKLSVSHENIRSRL